MQCRLLLLATAASLLPASLAVSRLPSSYRAYRYFVHDPRQGRSCRNFEHSELGVYCSGYGYNTTQMPNLLNHQNQTDARDQLKGFDPLVQAGCSSELPFLLCSLYFPICSRVLVPQSQMSAVGDGTVPRPRQEDVDLTTPCRSLCERVKASCLPVLTRFGYGWPEDLNCSLLQDAPVALGPANEIIVCLPRPPNTYQPQIRREERCPTKVCKSAQLRKNTFKKSKYHFAIMGSLVDAGMTNGRKSLHVKIHDVLAKCKQDVVPRPIARQLRANVEALILTNGRGSCDCPQLMVGQNYTMTGWVQGNNLVLNHPQSVLLSGTKTKSEKKIKKWVRKYCPQHGSLGPQEMVLRPRTMPSSTEDEDE